jgi:CRISPR-associated protein Cas1
MPNLYVTEQGAVIGKTGDRIVVRKKGETLLDVRSAEIGSVLIFGHVQISTQAMHTLLAQGVELALMTQTGKLVGLLSSPHTKSINLRLDQFKRYQDERFKLKLARRIVAAKISNQRRLIAGFDHNHPAVELKELLGTLEAGTASAERAESLDSLRGIEGSSARAYFSGFGKMILGDFSFEGRQKHPSPDPVNALLSLGYTMVFNEILSLLDGLGFDPYLGFFHNPEYGRASLAADLLEEFRGAVDRLTFFLINNRMLIREDFYVNPKDGACYLAKEALKKYFCKYEEKMTREYSDRRDGKTTLRKCLRRQAEHLAVAVKGGPDYAPYADED